MKITNSEIIRNGEQELIDAITADLDWGAVEDIFREQHNLGIDEDVQYKRGDIVVHDNRVAYRLEFEVKVSVSVLMDREGNHLSVELLEAKEENQEEEIDSPAEGLSLSEEEGQNGSSPQDSEISLGDQTPMTSEDPEGHEEIPEEAGAEKESGGNMSEAASRDAQPETESVFEEAISELQTTNTPDDHDGDQPITPDESSEEKISRMASQAGEIMEKMDD